MLSIRNKLLLLLFFVSLVPLLLLGVANYFQAKTVLIKSTEKSLFSLIESKKLEFEKYIDNTKSLAKSISDTDVVQEYIKNPAPERRVGLEKDIENLLYTFQENNWGKYHHLFLVNSSGQISISPNHGILVKGSPSSHLGESTSKNKWAKESLAFGTTTVSDFSSWVESDHNHQMLFYPIKNKQKKVMGLIGFELQIPYEMDILTQNLNLGETGKAYLTTSGGDLISYKTNNADKFFLDPKGMAEVKKTGQYTGHRLNEAGKDVLSVYFGHKTYPWILAIEVESAEILKGINDLKYKFLIFLVSTIVIVLLLSLYFSNKLTNPLKVLAQQMEIASKGETNITLDGINRKDEIGTLNKAFSRVLKSLEIMMKHNKLK